MTAPLPAKTAPVKPAGVELPFGYPLFGLYFRTNFPLPGLAASENPDLPEVPMHLGTEPPGFAADRYTELVHTSPFQGESGAPILVIRASEKGEYWLKYEEGTDVFTNSGIDELWVTWRAGSCLEDAATFLMGSVMAIVSQLRGSVCLHGCAVVIDGRVAALLGPQGAGKSTTAAAFASAGHAIAADDLVLLSERDGRFWVTPTCPIVRLWPSSVESLFGHEDALPRITEGWDKRWLNLSSAEYRFQTEPLPLASLYILNPRSAEDSAPSIGPLQTSAGLLRLIANSWAHYMSKPAFLAEQLRFLTRLSRSIPIRNLTAHVDAARLPELRKILIEDVRGIGPV